MLGYFFTGVLFLGLISFIILGVDGFKEYLFIIRISLQGDWYGIKEKVMVNLIGLLWRIFPFLGKQVIHWLGWLAVGISLVGLPLLWLKSREIGTKQFALAILISLFVSLHLHYHDLTLRLVTIMVVITLLVEKLLNPRDAALLPLVISLLFLVTSLVPVLKYNLPYMVFLILALLLYFPERLFFWRKRENEIVS